MVSVLKVFTDWFLFAVPIIVCVDCYNAHRKKRKEGKLGSIFGGGLAHG